MTARELRQVLFELNQNITLSELRKLLFEIEEQDKKLTAGMIKEIQSTIEAQRKN